MASIQVTEGLLMDLGWEITAKNGRTVSVEPPQDSKLLRRCVYVCVVYRGAVYVSNPICLLAGIRLSLRSAIGCHAWSVVSPSF